MLSHTRAWGLARISHHLATTNRDLQQSAEFPPIGLLDILLRKPPRPSGRNYHISQHLSILATRRGEICGLAALLCCLIACGPPKIDSSDGSDLVASVEHIKKELEPEQQQRFLDAFNYLASTPDLRGDPEYLDQLAFTCGKLHGKTAKQIVELANQEKSAVIGARLEDLELRRSRSQVARSVLGEFIIIEQHLFPRSPGFLDHAVAELQVKNRTGHRVYKAFFQASLRHRDELEPWVVQIVERPFGAGFGNRTTATFRIDLTAKDWDRIPEAGSAGVFDCSVVRLEGRRGKLIADADYGDTDEYLYVALNKRLEQLEAPVTW